MPIYEYACESCGKIFEEFQSISAPPLEKCTLCGSPSIKKIVSHTSFILKGSGWYVTDYPGKKPGGKDGGDKSGGGKRGGGKDGGDKGAQDKGGGDKSGSPGVKKSSGESRNKTPGELKSSKSGDSHIHT